MFECVPVIFISSIILRNALDALRLLSQRFQRSEYRFLSPSSKNYSRGTSSSHPLQARCKVRKPHGDTSKSNRFILLSVDKGTVPTLELIQSQLQQD
ncbi:hypothetical protein V6N13_026214 [Hibiscus sabdariffa]